jgi:hypothetical protein
MITSSFRARPFRAPLLVALLAVAGCTVQVDERSLIRPVAAPPLTAQAVAAAAPGLVMEQHRILASDGTPLNAVLLRRPGAQVTILYFGGNQFTVGQIGPFAARALTPLDANVMLVDYRGYGQSGGSPTAAKLMSDGLDAFDYLAALPGMDRGNIVVHGQSLGSFVAGHVAAERDSAGVVLESSVTTTEDWVRGQSGIMRVRLAPELAGQGNQRNIGRIAEPLLILVGARDTTTPPAMSQALYRLSPLPPARKSLSVVAGAGHNDVLMQPAALTVYRAFLDGLRPAR